MNGPAIELSLTESFAKHKRNLLLVCSIVAVLAVASPQRVKLPGLGTEEAVPGAVAYFLLGATLLYFFVSYCVELLAVRARNLEATASTSTEGVSRRLMIAVQPIASSIDVLLSKVQEAEASIKRVNGQLNTEGSDRLVTNFYNKIEHLIIHIDRIVDEKPDSVSQFSSFRKHIDAMDQKVSEIYREVNLAVSAINGGVKDFDKSKNEILKGIENIDNGLNGLRKKFDTISKRISASQRFGFAALEQAIPIGLFFIAFIVCFDGAFLQSSMAKFVRSHVPAINEAQRLDAQSGNQTNGKP